MLRKGDKNRAFTKMGGARVRGVARGVARVMFLWSKNRKNCLFCKVGGAKIRCVTEMGGARVGGGAKLIVRNYTVLST
jgi:hypothetical protein